MSVEDHVCAHTVVKFKSAVLVKSDEYSSADKKKTVRTIMAVLKPTTSLRRDGGVSKSDSIPAGGFIAGISESDNPGGSWDSMAAGNLED